MCLTSLHLDACQTPIKRTERILLCVRECECVKFLNIIHTQSAMLLYILVVVYPPTATLATRTHCCWCLVQRHHRGHYSRLTTHLFVWIQAFSMPFYSFHSSFLFHFVCFFSFVPHSFIYFHFVRVHMNMILLWWESILRQSMKMVWLGVIAMNSRIYPSSVYWSKCKSVWKENNGGQWKTVQIAKLVVGGQCNNCAAVCRKYKKNIIK